VVINFDLCDPQRYMQRIGRVGRFGRAGTAISIIPPYQVDKSSGRNYSIQHITEVPPSLPPSRPRSLVSPRIQRLFLPALLVSLP